MHTPEEAKSLWCPLAKVERSIHTMANCIADGCSAWRWEKTTKSVPSHIEGATGSLVRVWEIRSVKTHGYCGLAGKPY